MARPFKCRCVGHKPGIQYFKPRGVPLQFLEEVILTLDELEAVRLADLEGLYQEQAAEKMKVSRQTFGNILNSAHKKISDSLINGKAIKIEGGVYKMEDMRTFKCHDCNHEWQMNFGTGRPRECPLCKGKNIHRTVQDRGHARAGGRGRGNGRCRRSIQ